MELDKIKAWLLRRKRWAQNTDWKSSFGDCKLLEEENHARIVCFPKTLSLPQGLPFCSFPRHLGRPAPERVLPGLGGRDSSLQAHSSLKESRLKRQERAPGGQNGTNGGPGFRSSSVGHLHSDCKLFILKRLFPPFFYLKPIQKSRSNSRISVHRSTT